MDELFFPLVIIPGGIVVVERGWRRGRCRDSCLFRVADNARSRHGGVRFALILAFLWIGARVCEGIAAPSEPVVGFGVIPRYSPLVMFRSYQPIMDYLTEHTPYHFDLRVAATYEEAVGLLQNGAVEFAFLGGVTFAYAHRTCGAVPLLRPLNEEGKPFYRSVLVTRRNSDLQHVEQLKGHSFAFGSPHSTSGNLIPRYLLFEHGVQLTDLIHFENLRQHDSVAKAVLKGQFDAGAVKDVIADHYRRHGLRTLAESEAIPAVPIVCRPQTPIEMRNAVSKTLLDLDPLDPNQARLMARWDPEFRHGFEPAKTEDYEEIFRRIDHITDTCGNGCHH